MFVVCSLMLLKLVLMVLYVVWMKLVIMWVIFLVFSVCGLDVGRKLICLFLLCLKVIEFLVV